MFHDADNQSVNPSSNTPFHVVLSRRQFVGGLTALLASSALTMPASAKSTPSTLTFAEVPHGYDDTLTIADYYKRDILLRWGDAVTADAPAFTPSTLTPEAQAKQFGYNNDYVAFLPLPIGSNNSDHGLLCVNHEYTNANLMFEGVKRSSLPAGMTQAFTHVEMAAHGFSVVEVKLQDDTWHVVQGGYNRRFDALTTKYAISGVAKGSQRLATNEFPKADAIRGMIGNCAGGVTPWGTVLTCEENFSNYFSGDAPEAEKDAFARYGVGGKGERYSWWATYDDRFNIAKDPNTANSFGWVVEIDPYDPSSTPVKRTSLGRFKHEGANTVLAKDGRVVVYMGDDQAMEYIYKFVTAKPYNPSDRAANKDLLDTGTLYTARFNEDNTVTWLPLIYGENGLTPENGFNSQADVVINARGAADIVGATPMDRPEDIDVNPINNKIYAMITGHSGRPSDKLDAANPRLRNIHGHVLELTTLNGDHAATTGKWDIFLMAGNPYAPNDKAVYHPETSENGWLSMPDNCAFDNKGRLWITSDGMPKTAQLGDGLFACDVDGKGKALTRRFLRAPFGAEVTGICFTPDNTTAFVAIQHPAEHSDSLETLSTRWPDFDPAMPPRPSVIAIRHSQGRVIGS